MFEIELDDFKFYLYKLLRIQYDQEVLFENLAGYGVDMYGISVDNLDVILDIIGFPEDNSIEYDLAHDPERPNAEYKPEDYPTLFDRENYTRRYFDVKEAIDADEQMMVSEGKMEIIRGGNEVTIYNFLAEYIDWLFEEKKKLEQSKE